MGTINGLLSALDERVIAQRLPTPTNAISYCRTPDLLEARLPPCGPRGARPEEFPGVTRPSHSLAIRCQKETYTILCGRWLAGLKVEERPGMPFAHPNVRIRPLSGHNRTRWH